MFSSKFDPFLTQFSVKHEYLRTQAKIRKSEGQGVDEQSRVRNKGRRLNQRFDAIKEQ